MNLLPTAMTVWRDERSVDDALRHHDRAALAAAITTGLAAAVKLLGGTKYAQLATFLDADTVSAVGFLAAGAVAAFGHWAARGAIAAAGSAQAAAADAGVARTTGDRAAGGDAQPAAPVGGAAADAGASGAVRPGRAQATGPTGEFMP